MFGANPLRPTVHDDGTHLAVTEVFGTIQGEGPYSGEPAIFVRLAGCNLACWFCFVPSTKITMGDGTQKRIDQVQEGDEVLSWDGEKFVPKPVIRTMRSVAEHLVKVELSGNQHTWCTPEHPFLVSGKGWVPAEDLKHGDVLVHFSPIDRMVMFNPSKVERRGDRKFYSQTPEGKKYMSARLRRTWAENPGLRELVVQRMTTANPMHNPGVASKGFKTRVQRNKFKQTGLEKTVETICEGLPIEYVGDGKLIIGDACPDFAVEGRKKLIEVWSADAPWATDRGQEYIDNRREKFASAGYETLFLPLVGDDLLFHTGGRDRVREKVAQFIHNGTKVLSVSPVTSNKAFASLYGTVAAPRYVYNLEVADTHTYLAHGAVVHNCDTEFEVGVDSAVYIQDLLRQCNAAARDVKANLIVITGGEPMRQNIVPFISLALDAGWRVQIETAGTVAPPDFESVASQISIVCSPKTGKVNASVEAFCRDWKYIVGHDDTSCVDGLPHLSTQRRQSQARIFRPDPKVRSHRIWVQPREDYLPNGGSDLVSNEKNRATAAKVVMTYGYRLSLQTHKILGLP